MITFSDFSSIEPVLIVDQLIHDNILCFPKLKYKAEAERMIFERFAVKNYSEETLNRSNETNPSSDLDLENDSSYEKTFDWAFPLYSLSFLLILILIIMIIWRLRVKKSTKSDSVECALAFHGGQEQLINRTDKLKPQHEF